MMSGMGGTFPCKTVDWLRIVEDGLLRPYRILVVQEFLGFLIQDWIELWSA